MMAIIVLYVRRFQDSLMVLMVGLLADAHVSTVLEFDDSRSKLTPPGFQALGSLPSYSRLDHQPIQPNFHTANKVQSEVDERHYGSIQMLFVTDPADDMHMIASKKDKLLDTTQSWIIHDASYSRWLQDDRSLVLWLHEDPGKGKTMLAIALIDNFARKLQMEQSAQDTALLYFFCDNQDDRRKTASLILRGLIYQLLCQHPRLATYLHTEYEKQREQLFSSPNSLHTLWRIFQTIIENSGLREVLIVVDALDECVKETMETFLVLLEPCITNKDDDTSATLAKAASCNVKWLLTSRNEIMIKQLLTGSLDISLEENSNHVDEAVLKFIEVKVNHLTKIKNYEESLKVVAGDRLRQKAEGTFLWVALACRELSKPSVLSVNTQETLSNLPAGITPLYTRIMDQVLTSVDEKSIVYIQSILQSMIVALRPLTLPELAVAAGLPKQYHHNVHVLVEYVEQCGSMVTIRERQAHFVHLSAKTFLRQAQFIHLSAKTHLLENNEHGIVSSDLQIEHRRIAINCFQHVCEQSRSGDSRAISPAASSIRKNTEARRDVKQTSVSLEYPMVFWLDHAREASDDISDSFDLDQDFFQARSGVFQTWFEIYWTKTHSKSETVPGSSMAMHLAAYAELPWLLSKLIDAGLESDVHCRDSLGNPPLVWAAMNGHYKAVQLLLSHGAHVAAQNMEGVTALYWAANNGHENITQELLEKGANCRPQDKIGWTPLHRAAFNGHTGVARVLLDNGADIEAKDGTQWTALMRAATNGNLEIARLLIERDANIAIRDMEGCTLIHHAASRRHTSIVKLLAERGCDIERRDNDGWIPLHHADWNGHDKTVRFLLKHETDVHSRSDNGWTPLHQATWNGHVAVAVRLLKNSADPNGVDDEGETPLCQAAWSGHSAVAKLLLDEDADTSLKDRAGQTALHHAASNGSKGVVQLLLEAGADTRAQDNDDRKQHSQAEENFHHEIAKILRDRETEVYGDEVLPDTDKIPKTSLPDSQVDPEIIRILSADPETATIEAYGQAGLSTPAKITTRRQKGRQASTS